MAGNFDRQKNQALNGIDHSKKGSIDGPIVDLISYMNGHKDFFTTSSCSGRITVFTEGGVKKKGCCWLLTSHEPVDYVDIVHEQASDEPVHCKYEPFVLHVQCRDVERAQQMLKVAMEAGYRNSGLMMGKKKKILVAVRSTHGIEVPLLFNRRVRVSDEYITHLIELLNSKMESNFAQIERFYGALKKELADVT